MRLDFEMNKINYQRILDDIIRTIDAENRRPRLLLHACCAPCSSYVIEYLSRYFDITLYFYNPNISPESEYAFRADELIRLTEEMPLGVDIPVIVEKYNSDEFYNIVMGMEDQPEGGSRCHSCYRLRLEKSAEYAKLNGFDYFTTTLSISPYKNSTWLNEIGVELAREHMVEYLISDFKNDFLILFIV